MLDIALPLAGGKTVFSPTVTLLGMTVGFLTGLFGVGGGFLLTPALRILFGVPYPIAVGSGLMQIFFTGGVSAWKHQRNGNVDVRMGLLLACGAFGGTEIGKQALGLLDKGAVTVVLFGHRQSSLDLILNLLFLVLMVAVAASILLESPTSTTHPEETVTRVCRRLRGIHLPPRLAYGRDRTESISLWILLFLGFFAGLLTGLMGLGGGIVMFPILVYLLGVPTLAAVGTSAFMVVLTSAYGTLTHWQAGHVEVGLVAVLVLGSLAGVPLGVAASGKFGGRRIRKYFAAVLALGVLMILASLIWPSGT